MGQMSSLVNLFGCQWFDVIGVETRNGGVCRLCVFYELRYGLPNRTTHDVKCVMMTKLIIHPDLPARVEEMEQILALQGLKKDHVDVLWLSDEKLGVEQAKKIRQHLSLKPYSARGRAVVVQNFSIMTDEAQNSLLKTLEEPPAEAIILLGADSEKKILPTILSRVERIEGAGNRGQQNNSIPSTLNLESLLTMTIDQRFEYIEKLEDKAAFLHQMLEYFHHQLLTTHNSLHTDFAKDLLKAEEWAQANGNLKAILEYLMLKLP